MAFRGNLQRHAEVVVACIKGRLQQALSRGSAQEQMHSIVVNVEKRWVKGLKPRSKIKPRHKRQRRSFHVQKQPVKSE